METSPLFPFFLFLPSFAPERPARPASRSSLSLMIRAALVSPFLRLFGSVLVFLLFATSAGAVTVRKINVELPHDSTAVAIGATRVVLEFDEMPRFRVTDAIREKSLFYVDIYGLTKNYHRNLQSPDNAAVRHIDFQCLPEYAVLRVVVYVKPGAGCSVTETSNPPGLIISCSTQIPSAANGATTGPVTLAGGGLQSQPVQLAQAPQATPSAQISSPENAGTRLPLNLGANRPQSASGSERKKIVIIDPGHGGANSGARSKALVAGQPALEKDLTLAFAYQLKRIIDASGNMVAVVTRSDDSNISLQDRVRFAEMMGDDKSNIDLFISIHMNDGNGNNAARGFEIYYLDEKGAASAAIKALEEKENREIGTPIRKHGQSILEGILTDINRNTLENMKYESQLLCRHIERALTKMPHFRQHNRGIKSANFVVLKNFAMPAVLLEVGFITNTEDLRLLVDPQFQQATALMIYNGIASYFQHNDPAFRPKPIVIKGSK